MSFQGGLGAGVDPNSSRYKSANTACQHYKQTVPSFTPAEQADYLKAVACMRSHGIVGFPDPDFANGQVGFNIPSSVDQGSPQFLSALKTCEKLIPGLPYSS